MEPQIRDRRLPTELNRDHGTSSQSHKKDASSCAESDHSDGKLDQASNSEDEFSNVRQTSKTRRKSNNPRKVVTTDKVTGRHYPLTSPLPCLRKSERLHSKSLEHPHRRSSRKRARNHRSKVTRVKPRTVRVLRLNKAQDEDDASRGISLKTPKGISVDDRSETVTCDDESTDATSDTPQKPSKKKIVHKKKPCEICGRSYNTFYLKVHMRKHTGEKPFRCNRCDKVFSTDSLLRTHYQRYHGDTEELQCDVCQKVFASKGSLKIHKQIHSDEKPYKCNMCEKEFKQPGVLNEHLKTHSNDFPFQCEVCGKRFKSKRSVFRHKEGTHDGIKRTYMCTNCGKEFHDKSSLWRHQKRHEQGYTKHICEVCGKQFHERKVLSTHMLIHEGKKPYQCDVCKKLFRHCSVLKRHQSVHTGIKPFKCDLCSRQFIHRVYMLRHKCIHRNGVCSSNKTTDGGGIDTSDELRTSGDFCSTVDTSVTDPKFTSTDEYDSQTTGLKPQVQRSIEQPVTLLHDAHQQSHCHPEVPQGDHLVPTYLITES